MLRIARTEMVIKVSFDRPVGHFETHMMTLLMAGELGGRQIIDRRMGKATVAKVEQLLPGDLADVESAEMLALRLEQAGHPLLAGKARVGMSRAALLAEVFEGIGPNPGLVEIIVGALGAR